jgi:hypothetical protein
MYRESCISLSLVVLFAVCLPRLWADAERPDSGASGDSQQSGEIAGWIEQLDSNQFADRNDASRKLEAAGIPALAPLADAAVGGSREVTLRALDILRKHFQQGDEATKTAAKAALEKVAASDHASASRRAKDILDPPKPPPAAQAFQIAPGQIQIQINAVAGAQARRVRINNGVKQTEVTDGDRKVKIVENPNGSIQLEVTEKKNGKETTQKYEAKNADDLKKNHPDGHKVYEQYGKQKGPAIQIRGLQIQGGAVQPVQPLPAPAANRNPAVRKLAASQLKHARQLIESSRKQLQLLKAASGDKKLEESLESLEKIGQKLEEEAKKLSEGGDSDA